jgi:hypothetical protein
MRYRDVQGADAADAVRPKVARAFKALRKGNLICRMRFSCCMGCACAELEPMVKARKARGAVYFHKQDDSGFRKGQDLYVRYSVANDDEAEWAALGAEVKAALEAEGLVVEWDGSVHTAICVKTKESAKSATPEPARTSKCKPPLKLTGRDGNAFVIMGAAQAAAKSAGWSKAEIDEYLADAMSGDYDHLLQATMKRFKVS